MLAASLGVHCGLALLFLLFEVFVWLNSRALQREQRDRESDQEKDRS